MSGKNRQEQDNIFKRIPIDLSIRELYGLRHDVWIYSEDKSGKGFPVLEAAIDHYKLYLPKDLYQAIYESPSHLLPILNSIFAGLSQKTSISGGVSQTIEFARNIQGESKIFPNLISAIRDGNNLEHLYTDEAALSEIARISRIKLEDIKEALAFSMYSRFASLINKSRKELAEIQKEVKWAKINVNDDIKAFLEGKKDDEIKSRLRELIDYLQLKQALESRWISEIGYYSLSKRVNEMERMLIERPYLPIVLGVLALIDASERGEINIQLDDEIKAYVINLKNDLLSAVNIKFLFIKNINTLIKMRCGMEEDDHRIDILNELKTYIEEKDINDYKGLVSCLKVLAKEGKMAYFTEKDIEMHLPEELIIKLGTPSMLEHGGWAELRPDKTIVMDVRNFVAKEKNGSIVSYKIVDESIKNVIVPHEISHIILNFIGEIFLINGLSIGDDYVDAVVHRVVPPKGLISLPQYFLNDSGAVIGSSILESRIFDKIQSAVKENFMPLMIGAINLVADGYSKCKSTVIDWYFKGRELFLRLFN